MDEQFKTNLIRLETHCRKQLNNPNKIAVEEHAFTLSLIDDYKKISARADELFSHLQKAQTELQSLRADLQKAQAEIAVYKRTPVPEPVKPPVTEPVTKPTEEDPGW